MRHPPGRMRAARPRKSTTLSDWFAVCLLPIAALPFVFARHFGVIESDVASAVHIADVVGAAPAVLPVFLPEPAGPAGSNHHDCVCRLGSPLVRNSEKPQVLSGWPRCFFYKNTVIYRVFGQVRANRHVFGAKALIQHLSIYKAPPTVSRMHLS